MDSTSLGSADESIAHLSQRLLTLETLVSASASAAASSSEPGLDSAAVAAQLAGATRFSRSATSSSSSVAGGMSIIARVQALHAAVHRLQDAHPGLALLWQHQAAHPDLFPSPLAPAPAASSASSSSSAVATSSAGGNVPSVSELALAGDDVEAQAAQLKLLASLLHVLDDTAATPDLPALAHSLDAAEAATNALSAAAHELTAGAAAAARAYGAAVDAVSAQLVAWSDEIDRMEELVERAERAKAAGKAGKA